MSAEYNKTIARRWVRGFNHQNSGEMMEVHAEDATHFSPRLKVKKPETGGIIKGKPALIRHYEDAWEGTPSLRYVVESILAEKDRVLMEYIRKVEGEPDTKAVESFVIGEDDKLIHRSRVFLG